METQNETNKERKIQAGTQLEPELYAIVEELRTEEDRSMSNMIERLLKTHPRIQPVLESETATVGA